MATNFVLMCRRLGEYIFKSIVMDYANLLSEVSAQSTCNEIAEMAGLIWTESVSLRESRIEPDDLNRIDPFLDSLGRWDPIHREIVVDTGRCKKVPHSLEAVISTVVTHFCAKAVVHHGIHPVTNQQYLNWDDPGKEFEREGYPLKPTHPFYDELVREQELSTQIFTYLYLVRSGEPAVTQVFKHLSQGCCGLYSLHYDDSPDNIRVDKMLARDWERGAESDPEGTAADARYILGVLMRGLSLDKDGLYHLESDS